MPLMEEDPPSTLPEGKNIGRPFKPGTGSDFRNQVVFGLVSRWGKSTGICIKGCKSLPPASSKQTVVRPSSDKRPATAAPPDPEPITI